MKECVKCRKEILINAVRCPYCGAEQEVNMNCSEQTAETVKSDRKTELEPSQQSPGDILRIYGLVCGFVSICCSLMYLPYLNYYFTSDKLWGLGMVVAYAWCSLILFIIVYRCQREYGRHLLYALFIGASGKCALEIIKMQSELRYYSSDISDYYSVVGTIVAILGCWYLMKKDDLIQPLQEGDSFIRIVKEIPKVINEALFRERNTSFIKVREEKKQENAVQNKLASSQIKVHMLIRSRIFLIFSILYTGNLLYRLISEFSFLRVAGNLLVILMCIGLWLVYYSCRNNMTDKSGFSMVKGVITTKFILHMILDFIILLAIFAVGPGIEIKTVGLILILLDLFYWSALNRMAGCVKEMAYGKETPIYSGVYPIVILFLNVLFRGVIFTILSYIQNTANNAVNSINQYGNQVTSSLANIFNLFGVDYGYGYETSSSLVQSFISPVNEWIETTFGFGQSTFAMLLSISIPICEIVLLVKLNSYKEKNQMRIKKN